MYCMNCGAELSNNARFCTNCGTAVFRHNAQKETAKEGAAPAGGASKKKTVNRIVTLLLAAFVLVLAVFAAKGIAASFAKDEVVVDDGEKTQGTEVSGGADTLSGGRKYEGRGFKTPEDAARCYIEGLKSLDYEKMLSAFAWETQAENYSVEANLNRMRSYSPSYHPRMPSTHEFLIEANLQSIRAQQADLIYRSLEAYLLADAYQEGRTVSLPTDEDTEDYLSNFDLGRLKALSEMKNIRFVSPDSVTDDHFSAERNQKNLLLLAAIYGADELANVVILADVGDGTLYAAPTVARYGDRWYLVSVGSLTSAIAGISSNSQAFSVLSEEDRWF